MTAYLHMLRHAPIASPERYGRFDYGSARAVFGRRQYSTVTTKSPITWFYVFAALLNFYMWLSVWVVYFVAHGMSLLEIGGLDAAGWVAMFCAQIPTGILADAIGRKKTIMVGVVLYALSLVGVIGFPVNSALFVVGFIMWPLALSFVDGADEALLYGLAISDGTPFSKVVSRYQFIARMSQAFGALLGAVLIAHYPLACFGGTAILAGLAAVILAGLIPEKTAEAACDRMTVKALSQRLVDALRAPKLVQLIGLNSLLATFPFIITFVLVQPLVVGAGLPVEVLGIVVVALRVTSAAGTASSAYLQGKLPAKTLMGMIATIIVTSLVVLGIIPSPYRLIGLLTVAWAGGALSPLMATLINHTIPNEIRASVVSASSAVQTGFIALIEPAFLATARITTMDTSLEVWGVAIFVAASMMLLRLRKLKIMDTTAVS